MDPDSTQWRPHIPGHGDLASLAEVVRSGEVDWDQVSLGDIAGQVRRALEEGQLDMEGAAHLTQEVLGLMEKKALALLPSPREPEEAQEESEEDYREAMLARLQEYRAVRQAASQLEDLAREQETRFSRLPPEIREWEESLSRVEGIGLEDLVEALNQVLAEAPEEAEDRTESLGREEFPLEEVMSGLENHLRALDREVELLGVFPRAATRPQIVATFLALLELIRIGRVRLQRDPEEETIYVRYENHEPKPEQ